MDPPDYNSFENSTTVEILYSFPSMTGCFLDAFSQIKISHNVTGYIKVHSEMCPSNIVSLPTLWVIKVVT